ncbi:MAG TPA: cytochrome c [Myxococcota bacterium]|nr:cytochrome c [Myxococcota bacterium]
MTTADAAHAAHAAISAAATAVATAAAAALIAAVALLAACDPRVTHHPADKGPPPGPIGAGAVLADDGWKAPAAPAMPGMGAMGAAGSAAPDEVPTTDCVALGDGRGLPMDGPGLYDKLCMRCHGTSGKGDGPMAGMLTPGDLTAPEMHARLTDDKLTCLLVHGRKKMPAFGPAIAPSQLAALVAHVRTLRRTSP